MTEAQEHTERTEFSVTKELDGARLDKAAVALAEGLSRARVKKAIEDGAVRVNGRRRAKGDVVSEGDIIAIELGKIASPDAKATPDPDTPLEVVFDGEGVLIVSKPAGQSTAPLKPFEKGTLAGALVARYPELEGIGYGPREPGLVHRLDTETSGLVVVAKTAEASETLKAALKDERISKTYLLLCTEGGLADRGTIEFPIANHPKDQRRVYPCIHPRDVMRYAPRPARTEYEVLGRSDGSALVRANAPRAVRHQIRAHFAAIHHPLLGDTLYGGPRIARLTRHALHASGVSFEGAKGVAAFDVETPLPPDLEAVGVVPTES